MATTPAVTPQVPPTLASDKVVDDPSHILKVPVIAGGNAVTVITDVMAQPDEAVYVMVEVPKATPVAIPVLTSIEIFPGVLLAHVPGVVASTSVAVLPRHTIVGPAIADGSGLMVMLVVLKQPLAV